MSKESQEWFRQFRKRHGLPEKVSEEKKQALKEKLEQMKKEDEKMKKYEKYPLDADRPMLEQIAELAEAGNESTQQDLIRMLDRDIQ